MGVLKHCIYLILTKTLFLSTILEMMRLYQTGDENYMPEIKKLMVSSTFVTLPFRR